MDTMLLDSLTASRARDSLPSVAGLNALATFFDALSDVTRLKIISALSVSAMCVTDLALVTSLARREEYPAYHVGGSGRGAPRQ